MRFTRERTVASFEQFFTMIGEGLAGQIEFVCSDMWQPYLMVIRERCSEAIHILDRFHIVAKMNTALDQVRAGEARRLARDGYEPVLKKTRWCVLKRRANLTMQQRFRLRDLVLQPADRAGLSAEGGLPAILGVRVTELGRQVPR
jgi:transposase